MVVYCVRKGVPHDKIMSMDVITFCSLHDRLFKSELREVAQQTRLDQFAAQGDSKQLNEVLKPIDEITGKSEDDQRNDLNQLATDLQQGKL